MRMCITHTHTLTEGMNTANAEKHTYGHIFTKQTFANIHCNRHIQHQLNECRYIEMNSHKTINFQSGAVMALKSAPSLPPQCFS